MTKLFETPEPATQHTGEAPAPVRLADELEQIEALIHRYVKLSDPALAMLIAVWIANTYTFECFDYCGYLHIQSATPECGKTTLLKVLRYLSKGKPPILTAPTAAGLFRSQYKVLLIDEAERLRDHDKDNFGTLITVLNAGIEKDGQVERLEKTARGNFKSKTFEVYGPKGLAGIEDIADTLESRSFHIRMQRAAKRPQRLRERRIEREARPIRERLEAWASEKAPALREAYDTLLENTDSLAILEGYGDRFQDLAEPLVLLATIADQERQEGARILPQLQAGLEAAWGRRAPLDREYRLKTFLELARTQLGKADRVFVRSQDLLWMFETIPALAGVTTFEALAKLLKPFDLSPRSNGEARGYDITSAWVDEWSARYDQSARQRELTPLTGLEGVSTTEKENIQLAATVSTPADSSIPPRQGVRGVSQGAKRKDSQPMTKDELVKGALTQLGVVSTAPRSLATAFATVAWHSPRFGSRSGRLLIAPGDGWVLVDVPTYPGSWVWVHASRLDKGVGGL
jgi:hypothetical protein